MSEYLPFIIVGMTTGAVYALSSFGLVLTYRTSGVFNFGHGAVGMFATFLFYSLRQELPTGLALVVTVLIVAPIMGALIDAMFRRLYGAGATAAIVASLGLLVGLQGLVVVLYGGALRRMSPIFPTSNYGIAGVNVGIDQTIIVASALVAGLCLVVFFRGTRLGLQTRAVVENRPLLGLTGVRAIPVTRMAWMLGSSFAALSGIVFAPLVGLDSLLLTLLVVQAFGAAAVGRLVSFPATAVGAFGLGVGQALATKVLGETGVRWLQGLPSALPFVLLFVVLVFAKKGSFREVAAVAPPTANGRTPSVGRFKFPKRSLTVVVVAAVVAAPFASGARLVTFTATAAYVLIFASLSLLVGLSRQLSLTHAIFVAFGATTVSHLQEAGVPYLIALPLAALLVTPVGAALAIPAVRLSTLYLGLATFGFGLLAQDLLFPTGLVFGAGVRTITRPAFLEGDLAFYYFTLAVVVVGITAVELVRVTRLGRILVALADSPKGVDSIGMNPVASRVVIFCVSTFLAALAGGLLGTLTLAVSSTSFTFFQSLVWLTVLVAAGARTFGGSVLAAILLIAVPAVFTSPTVAEWQPLLFGAAAILFAQTGSGLIGALQGLNVEKLAGRHAWRLGSERGRLRWQQFADGAGGVPAVERAR